MRPAARAHSHQGQATGCCSQGNPLRPNQARRRGQRGDKGTHAPAVERQSQGEGRTGDQDRLCRRGAGHTQVEAESRDSPQRQDGELTAAGRPGTERQAGDLGSEGPVRETQVCSHGWLVCLCHTRGPESLAGDKQPCLLPRRSSEPVPASTPQTRWPRRATRHHTHVPRAGVLQGAI